MAGRGDVPTLREMLTDANASVFGATDYGLAEGNQGSLVVFDSPNALNALRIRAPERSFSGPASRSPGRTRARLESSVSADSARSTFTDER